MSTTVPFDCPRCGTVLTMSDRQGIEIDYCPTCRGIWLDRGELDKILERSVEAAPAPQAGAVPPQAAAGWTAPQQAAGGWGQPPVPQPGYGGYGSHGSGHGGGHGSGHGGGQGSGHGGNGGRRSWLHRILD